MTDATYDLAVEHQIAADPGACFDGFISMYGEDRPDWITDSALDLRSGGTWDVRFHTPGNEPFREHRVITDLDHPDRLGYDMTASSDAGLEQFSTHLDLTFAPTSVGTTVRLRQTGFPDAADRDEFAASWPRVLILLAERVTG